MISERATVLSAEMCIIDNPITRSEKLHHGRLKKKQLLSLLIRLMELQTNEDEAIDKMPQGEAAETGVPRKRPQKSPNQSSKQGRFKNKHLSPKPLPDDMPEDINLKIGEDELINHGIITNRPAYHTQRHIFPIGYQYKHKFTCLKHPKEKHHYLCEILDGGDNPVFRVTSICDENVSFTETSSSACFSKILQELQHSSPVKRQTFAVQGTRCFGLTEPVVVDILKELPGVSQLQKYQGPDSKRRELISTTTQQNGFNSQL
ncbi:MAG: hypothetical protein EZS28_017339 [Streblomastix strix]|uniref:FYR N-terminal domain-containing protein n=1 Tax=Streblomastix strix TaxID=222440 RepID=A0A5J4VX22_9EUKA|nr:MAG: hypothetical protein EZS28_017339 [Streblomastix strix]